MERSRARDENTAAGRDEPAARTNEPAARGNESAAHESVARGNTPAARGAEEPAAPDAGVNAFVAAVAANVRALRLEAGLTLADLAAAAGLGKSTLAQLESGKGNPSVETLWAIAAALRVPFARLIDEERPSVHVVRASDVTPMRSEETYGWAGRLLTASHRRGTFDLYSLDLETGGVRHAEPHHAGVVEHLLVVEGRLRVGPQTGPVDVTAGDLVTFAGDVPHVYEALERTHAVLLMSYP